MWLSSLQEGEERHKARHTKKNTRWGYRHTEGKERVTMGASTSQKASRFARNTRTWREAGDRVSLRSYRRNKYCPHLDFRVLGPERLHFCCVKPPSLWSFVMTVLENRHKSLPLLASSPSTRAACLQAKEKWGLWSAQFTKQDREGWAWSWERHWYSSWYRLGDSRPVEIFNDAQFSHIDRERSTVDPPKEVVRINVKLA